MSSAAQVARTLGTDSRSMELKGTVGFASLPDQLVNKSVAKGFDFNILCVGETAVGKSTLIDSLFKANFEDTPVSHKQPQVGLTRQTYNLKESNVNLRLTIVSSTGYGDQINKENSFKPIVEYIDNQFEIYLQEELKIKRNLVETHDTRIHACLYFISPTGHSLKSLDLVCMKELDKKVNIIPIIAKADTISRQELLQFKKKIMEELGENGLRIYTFPTEDATVAEINNKMNEQIPFAVVGSREEIVAGGQRIRARKYPWGVVEVENETHCDFVKLREMIIRTNMEDLREKTHSIHYELYRRNKLTAMGFTDMSADNRPVSLQETYEQKRTEHLKEMQAREERMRQMFVQKVKDKEAQLKSSEQKLHDEFERMRKQHTDEKKQLDDKRTQLDDDINEFNKRKMQLQAQRAQTEIAKTANPATMRSPRK